MSSDISRNAYRWAAGFYALFLGYFFYFFWEAGIFLAQHYIPESAEGFSLANPNFRKINFVVAGVGALVVTIIMWANEKLRYYIVDVGDELCRVSWADLKETQKSTVIVVGLATVAAIFMFVADQFFLQIVNFVLKFAVE